MVLKSIILSQPKKKSLVFLDPIIALKFVPAEFLSDVLLLIGDASARTIMQFCSGLL